MLKPIASPYGKPPAAPAQAAQAAVVADAAPLPPRLPAFANDGALSPRQVRSLKNAIDAARCEEQRIAKDSGRESASATLPESHGWNRSRQALGRALSAIAHADRLPPQQAGLTYAKLMQGTALLMNTPLQQALSEADVHTLHALLLTGEHHNRWTAHSGMPSQKLVPLVYRAVQAYAAAVVSAPQGIGNKRLEVTPLAFGRLAALIAHEGVHEAQHNAKTPRGLTHYTPREAMHGTAHHPRAGMLEAARNLPFSAYAMGTASDQNGPHFHLESHALKPVEAQAYSEEATATLLLPLQHTTLKMEPFPAGCGVDQLVQLLVRAGWQLNEADSAQPRPSAAEKAQGEPATALYDNPRAAALVEQILFSTAELHAAVQSSGWNDAAQQTLHDRLAAVQHQSQQPPCQGVELLQEIASTMGSFLDGLKQQAPYALQTPAERAGNAVQQPFDGSKADPVAVLHQLMVHKAMCDENAIPSAPNISAEQMARAFDAARADSGFDAGVQALIDRNGRNGRVPEPAAVVDTVTRLAARLMGLDIAQLPADLWPAINFYEAPSIEIERFAGLNAPPATVTMPAPAASAASAAVAPVTSHQKRKAVFDPVAWQLHVPQHFFHPSQADRLPARLAGLAADMAYTAVAALAHNNPAGWRTDHSLSAAGLWGAEMPAMSSPALHALGQSPAWARRWRWHDHAAAETPASSATASLLPTAAQGLRHQVLMPVTHTTPSPAEALNRLCMAHIAAHPHSAAAVLRAVVKVTPVKDLGHLWHLGPRAEVKHAAQHGEPGAQAAYEASSLQRWQLPAVAFRRAVMRTALEAAAAL